MGPFRLLDAGRGLAALAVVLYHGALVVARNHDGLTNPFLNALSHGALGVEVFFVISGFCIAASLESLLRRDGTLAQYARARARRIYPPYWGALVLSALFAGLALLATRSGLLGASSLAESVDRLRPAPLLANVALAQAALRQPSILAVAWTLCYEVVFYAILGAIGFVAARVGRKGAALEGAHVLTIVAALSVWSPVRLVYPLDLWPAFGLGVVLYDALKRPAARLWLALCAVAVAAMAFRGGGIGYLPHAIAPFAGVSVGFTLLMALLHRHDARLSALPPTRALAWVGDLSYSLYLLHFLTLGVVGQLLKKVSVPAALYPFELAAMVGASLLTALLFHRTWERRFLGKKSAPAPRLAD